MKIRRIRTLLGALLTVAVITLLTLTTASAATTPNQCGNGGTGYCLNDWNNAGAGGAVKMNNGHTPNSGFEIFGINTCDGGDIIHSDCLNQWGGVTAVLGAETVEINYVGTSLCVGTNGNGYAIMVQCGTGTGYVFALGTGTNCSQNYQHYYTNRYWTNINQFETWLKSGGNVGVQAFYTQTDNTCWGQVL